MRVFLFLMLAILTTSCSKQTIDTITDTNKPIYHYQDFEVTHYQNDTLYFLKDYFISEHIYQTWVNDTSWDGHNPTIAYKSFLDFFKLKMSEDDIIMGAKYSIVNSSRDTMYLLNSSILSYYTYECWRTDPIWDGNNPRIIFLDESNFRDKLTAEHDVVFSEVSMSRDTLYLRDDHMVSYLTYDLWENFPDDKVLKPIIRFVSPKKFIKMKKYNSNTYVTEYTK